MESITFTVLFVYTGAIVIAGWLAGYGYAYVTMRQKIKDHMQNVNKEMVGVFSSVSSLRSSVKAISDQKSLGIYRVRPSDKGDLH